MWSSGVNLSEADILYKGTASAFGFTFSTHLERPQKLDKNQNFLIVGPVQRDAAVGMENLSKLSRKGI